MNIISKLFCKKIIKNLPIVFFIEMDFLTYEPLFVEREVVNFRCLRYIINDIDRTYLAASNTSIMVHRV